METPLASVAGLAAATVKMLAREGIVTAGDLLAQFPFRHEDRRRMEFRGFAPSPEPVCHHVRVTRARTVRFGRRSGFFEAECVAAQDNPLNQQLALKWFNMPFMNRTIAVDMELIVYGKIKDVKGRLVMSHPEYEIVRGDEEDDAAQVHTGRIVPVYRLRGGLKQKPLRAAVWRVLERFDANSVDDLLPAPKDNGEFAGLSRGRALRDAHFPEETGALDLARRYLALEEFYILQLRVLRRRAEWRSQAAWPREPVEGRLAGALLARLPFELTAAQRRCLDEIQRDISRPEPMNRLLHGDVGSGKTIVAFAAMLQTVEGGHQAALMAPTQILAEQHYANARGWLEPLGLRVALHTADKKLTPGVMPLFEQSLSVAPSSPSNDQSSPPSSAQLERTRPRVPQSAPTRTAPDVARGARYHKRRLPHFERPWAIYHVTTHTLDRLPLSPAERDIVLHHALEAHRMRQVELLAVCVMPDHVHLLFEPQPKSRDAEGEPEFWPLGDIMSGIKSASARGINKLRGSRGSIWEKESFDIMVRGDEDLQGRFLYIVRNPREAGLVGDDEEYRWLWTRDDEGRGEDVRVQSAGAWTAARGGACAPRDVIEKDAEGGVSPAGEDWRGKWSGSDEPHIIIGTHALLYEAASMPRLGLAVIDEQHKFGVTQRSRLITRGHAPDVLVMTATPIPRTLALTVYGDLDVSTIDEKPKARGEIVTAVRGVIKLPEIAKFMHQQLDEGRQAYVVYPLIEESEKIDAGAAKAGVAEWSALLKPHAVGLLHGRMDAAEKDEVMRKFRDGEIKALVSTTVIEVGVDVPNASVMVIYNAERFGLAQIHQLRGRIGRGAHKSHCVLLIPDKDAEAKERLGILEETGDGFRIAEEDLKRRGPGDLLGSAQSGQAPLRFAELLADTRLLTLARRIAERALRDDPGLASPEHAVLRGFVVETAQPAATLQ